MAAGHAGPAHRHYEAVVGFVVDVVEIDDSQGAARHSFATLVA
jgi:hypothetical protein